MGTVPIRSRKAMRRAPCSRRAPAAPPPAPSVRPRLIMRDSTTSGARFHRSSGNSQQRVRWTDHTVGRSALAPGVERFRDAISPVGSQNWRHGGFSNLLGSESRHGLAYAPRSRGLQRHRSVSVDPLVRDRQWSHHDSTGRLEPRARGSAAWAIWIEDHPRPGAWTDASGTVISPSDADMLATMRLAERMRPFPYFETTILGTELARSGAFAAVAGSGSCNST